MGMKSPEQSLKVVRAALDAAGYLTPSAPLLAAVSGGADSMALLFMLHELEVPVVVAHYDHQTRDGDSYQDAAFVQSNADRLGLPFYLGTNNVPAIAAEAHGSFEEVARELRYLFLIETAEEHGCVALVTGHHADDQAETVLMRVLRGTSPRGLAGIGAVSEREGFTVLRPMLSLTREDIIEYVSDRELEYFTDPTNRDHRFLRNRIRHELMPFLTREYNSNLREALTRMAAVQRDENAFLTSATEAFLQHCMVDSETIERRAFRYGHSAVQRRAILDIAWQHGVQPDFDRVLAAVQHIVHGETGAYCDLGGDLQLCNGKEDTLLVQAERRRYRQRQAVMGVPGEVSILGKHFFARVLDDHPDDLRAYCTATRQVFDADRLGERLALRTCRDGDAFTPLGLRGTKKIGDYFTDIGLPAPKRQQQVVVEANGEIVWVVGHAVAATAAVRSDTKRYAEVIVGDATSA